MLRKYDFRTVLLSIGVCWGAYLVLHEIIGLSFRKISKRRLFIDSNMPHEAYYPFKILGRFENPFPEYVRPHPWEWFYLKMTYCFRSAVFNKLKFTLPDSLANCGPDFDLLFPKDSRLYSFIPQPYFTVTWLGESSFFIQVKSLNILTDPFVLRGAGAERESQKNDPLSMRELFVQTDVVLVSHNHYNHLDQDAARCIGNKAQWYVPLGLKSWLNRLGIFRVIELNWWQEVIIPEFPSFSIAAVPTMHWSGRSFFDTNKSLWCAFILRYFGKSVVMHVGDTGYVDGLFSAIKDVYGSVDLTLLPITANEKSRLPLHLEPDTACKIHRDSSASRSLTFSHFGLGDDSDDLLKKLFEEAKRLKIPKNTILPADLGRTMVISWNETGSKAVSGFIYNLKRTNSIMWE